MSFFIQCEVVNTRTTSQRKVCLYYLLIKHDFILFYFVQHPRSRVLWKQKLKTHLLRTLSLKVLPLKPGVGHYIAMHAIPTARVFSPANFYPPGPFSCIFCKTSPKSSLCWLWLAVANTSSCVGFIHYPHCNLSDHESAVSLKVIQLKHIWLKLKDKKTCTFQDHK